jgi:peptide/nickel transport system ATP-binding protein
MTAVGTDDLLVVEGLKVHFPIKRGIIFDRTVGHVRAVDGVDLAVPRGSTYGLVGESGCGKSTLGRAILRLTEPTAGRVLFDGTDVAALKGEPLRHMRQRMQMVFQDPLGSLDPRQNVESLLSEPLRAHGLGGDAKGIAAKIRGLLDAVGLPTASLRRYPHEFSGGQRQRIGIARALALNPKLVVADEPVSALDVSIQAQVINLLDDLQDELGLTYVIIAHDLSVIRHVSDRIAVMYLGKIVELTDRRSLYESPMHPYTRALLSAVPVPDPRRRAEGGRERILLQGDVPSPIKPPSGCRFHTRCWKATEVCKTAEPPLVSLAPGHEAACHHPENAPDQHPEDKLPAAG